MSQTYFDYPREKRYTWISPNGQTHKVIDYILVDKYVQFFMKDCSVDQKLGFCTDHNMVVAVMKTPTTKRS